MATCSGELPPRALVRFTGVFERLADEDEFRKVRVNEDTGTVEWPSGADLDPVVLYAALAGKTVDEVLSIGAPR